jgi:hypothetical protein
MEPLGQPRCPRLLAYPITRVTPLLTQSPDDVRSMGLRIKHPEAKRLHRDLSYELNKEQ